MRCTVCKKSSEEKQLFNGILGAEMVMICEDCAEDQKVPIIRKPTTSQLDKADKRFSVRERMEIMSGVRDATEISEDQIITQGNLAKLRAPPKKQTHEGVMDNYYWNLSMARRRRKISVAQLAEKMEVEPEVIRNIEKGILPENFQDLFIKLESYLGVKLLKMRRDRISFVRTNPDAEKDIINAVRKRMEEPQNEQEEELKEEDMELIEKEDQDAEEVGEDEELEITSKKDLSKITISDLLGRKRRRDAREKRRREKEEMQEMMDDDLDLEIEEL